MSTARLFLRFVKKPLPHLSSGLPSTAQKIGNIIQLVALTYGLIVPVMLLNEAFVAAELYESTDHLSIKQLVLLRSKSAWSDIDWETMLFIVISAVGISPVLEEVAFRLFLRYRPHYVLISFSLQFFLLLGTLGATDNAPLMVVIGLAIGIAVAVATKVSVRYQRLVSRWWHQRFPFVYYYSSIVFGLIHYAAYGLQGNALWFAPVVLAPIVMMGLMLGFVRIRYGMSYAIVTHASINALGIALAFLFA